MTAEDNEKEALRAENNSLKLKLEVAELKIELRAAKDEIKVWMAAAATPASQAPESSAGPAGGRGSSRSADLAAKCALMLWQSAPSARRGAWSTRSRARSARSGA